MKYLIYLFSSIAFFISWSQNSCQEGQEYYNTENYTKAIEVLKNCLITEANNEEARFTLGKAYAKQEDWEKAAATYKILVETHPKNADYNFYYGGSLGLYAKKHQPFKVCRIYQRH